MGRKKKVQNIDGQTEVETATTELSATKKKITKLKFMAEEQLEKKEMEIRSASLRDLFCTYSYDHNLPSNIVNNITVKSEVPVHEDMGRAFKKLKVHLALICEEIKPEELLDIDGIEDYDESVHNIGSLEHKVSLFDVGSWRIDGKFEKEGIVLSGYKRLSSGDSVKLETPKVKWKDNYAFIDELGIAIHDCIVEVEQHHDGKRAPEVQQKLDFQDDEHYAEDDL